jgi:Tol biopolymer transport system component
LTVEARSMEESGETRSLLTDAIWPAPAPNGTQLAVVTVRPEDAARGLGLYDLERDTLHQLVAPGRFDDVDSPVFSTDGRWLYFFAADYSTVSAPAVLAGWRGVAHAHSNQPGLWWRIGVSGGGLEAVTADPEIVSHGTMTHDGRLLYTSSAGVRIVSADGIRTLFTEPFYGAVAALAP